MKINEVYNEIDLFVKEAIEKGVVVNIELNEKEKFAFRYLIAENILIQGNKKNQYNVGINCFEIHRIGIEDFLNQKDHIEKLDFKIRNLTLKDLKGNIFQNKLWWVFILINLIISIIVIYIQNKFL
jgi:hypothetical protein